MFTVRNSVDETYDAYEKDIAIALFYFKQPTAFEFTRWTHNLKNIKLKWTLLYLMFYFREAKMTTISFISQASLNSFKFLSQVKIIISPRLVVLWGYVLALASSPLSSWSTGAHTEQPGTPSSWGRIKTRNEPIKGICIELIKYYYNWFVFLTKSFHVTSKILHEHFVIYL